MYWLYSAALAMALVLTSPYWIVRLLRQGRYRAPLGERLGRVPARLLSADLADCIWVHAVSVGEVVALAPLIAAFERRRQRRVVISTTTAAGQRLARERFGEENVFYFPLDFAFAVRPYLRALRPELVVLAETEFWPNFLRLVKGSGARIAVVNARISDRSLPGYMRWRWLLARVLKNVDLFMAQSDEDANRLQRIGAHPARVCVSGNLKFDVQPSASVALVERLRSALRAVDTRHILVCGSTVEGEESWLVEAFQRIRDRHARTLLVLAPRHPQRFEAVASHLAAWRLPWWRRSRFRDGEILGPGIFLLDSVGELGALYALATIAFVGGSLAPRGGHNILEPAHYGVPIVVGPHTANFRDIVAIFLRAGAVEVAPRERLADVFSELLDHEERRQAIGRRALEVLRSQSGATARTLAALEGLLAEAARPAVADEVAHPA